MAADEAIRVSVVYALPDRQTIVELKLLSGASVAEAVEKSGLVARYAEIAKHPLACAIYGRAVKPDAPLRDGDRVEILRPLLIDPKESRRQAASRERAKKR
jgi:putative ubiquitin-RnfH superfamily antitoxin RatB of RatAB toxin-antitoxin module